MINKKNLLGKTPDELGTKDAIHTAIVAVRAGEAIKPGQRCGLNKEREAVMNSKGCGVADPFLKSNIMRGEAFWLLLAQDEVPNVQHVWEHPDVDFSPPKTEIKRNKTLQTHANLFGVTYEQIMAACAHVAEHTEPAPYPGSKTVDEVKAANEKVDKYDLWPEFVDESLYQFYNSGTECCPEYDYPDCDLFEA